MSHLSAEQRRNVRAAATRFLHDPYHPNLPHMLYDALMERGDLDTLAFQGPAERFIGVQEAWASAAGAICADAARRAFRAAERAKRDEMQRALWRQHEREAAEPVLIGPGDAGDDGPGAA